MRSYFKGMLTRILCRLRNNNFRNYPVLKCNSSFKIFDRSIFRAYCKMADLKSVPKVDIDPSGVFKYILIKVHGEEVNNIEPSIVIVRGYKRCNYHSDIFDEVQEKLKPLDCECLGGGRISHDAENKKIHIYGYSQGYGKADHEVTAKIVKESYPAYSISISDEGY